MTHYRSDATWSTIWVQWFRKMVIWISKLSLYTKWITHLKPICVPKRLYRCNMFPIYSVKPNRGHTYPVRDTFLAHYSRLQVYTPAAWTAKVCISWIPTKLVGLKKLNQLELWVKILKPMSRTNNYLHSRTSSTCMLQLLTFYQCPIIGLGDIVLQRNMDWRTGWFQCTPTHNIVCMGK